MITAGQATPTVLGNSRMITRLKASCQATGSYQMQKEHQPKSMPSSHIMQMLVNKGKLRAASDCLSERQDPWSMQALRYGRTVPSLLQAWP